MSSLPSFPLPVFFGNDYPVMSLTDLLTEFLNVAFDEYKNYDCACCGKTILAKNGIIEGTDDNAFLICTFCHNIIGDVDAITYDEQNMVYQAMGNICDKAINPELSDSYSYPWV